MISKQKAKRIACGIVYDELASKEFPIGPGWETNEREAIAGEIVQILAELKKKSQ